MTDQRINVQTSLNSLCLPLEYHLCAAFANSSHSVFKYLWCDFIDQPVINELFTVKNITSIKQVTTKALIGTNGSSRYDMIIKLGPCSRRKALRGLNLNDCLPDAALSEWIEIDIQDCFIVLQLN